jgi:fatty acid amide hydrolase
MIARGDISSVEAVEAHIERIERVNPRLNAVVVKRYDAARTEAREADERRARGEALGPLHGVPLTIKESLDLVDTPSTFGLPLRANVLARQDDFYVARMRKAGAIILGKTNVAQLLYYIESDNPLYGRTNNPWNLERSPGGSSGGQAAIIAAGGSPMGLATDIGGSIRVPATFCGIAGLKPTAGRTPDAGRFSEPLGERAIVSQVGVTTLRRVKHTLRTLNQEISPY